MKDIEKEVEKILKCDPHNLPKCTHRLTLTNYTNGRTTSLPISKETYDALMLLSETLSIA